MMALIRFIYDFVRKEELVALNYIREHPRRNWLIALDALITVSLVFGGVSYAAQSSNNATTKELMRIGALPMTASEFVEHAHAEGAREYWLGELKGFGISSDDRQENQRLVSYAKNGSNPMDLKTPEITIATYQSSIDAAGSNQFAQGVELATSVTAGGRVVQYDKTSMVHEVVSIVGNSTEISIHYQSAQSLQTLLDNATALRIAE